MSISIENLTYLTDQILLLEGDHAESVKVGLDKIVQNSLVLDLHDRWTTDNDDCIQITLAILIVYKKLDILPCQTFFDLFITIPDNHNAKITIGNWLENNRSISEILELADWLVSLIGKQVWEYAAQFHPSQRFRDVPFEGAAIILDCIAQYVIQSDRMSQSIEISRFQVYSMDTLIDKLKSTKKFGWLQSLRNYRHIIPTNSKLRLLEYQFQSRKSENERQVMFDHIYSGTTYRRDAVDQKHKCNLILERDTILQDSINAFEKIRKSITIDDVHVSFVAEDGQDRGGLTKEWCLLMVQALEDVVLIRQEDEAEFMDVNPACTEEQAYLFGIVLGIAILQKVVLDVSLSPFVYEILVKPDHHIVEPDLNMLKLIRPGLANGLFILQSWDEDRQGLIEESFALDFTFVEEKAKIINLIPNGEQMQVNKENRTEYIDTLCQYILVKRTRNTITTIRDGFERICHGITGLQLLTSTEWDKMIRGEEIANNAAALRQSCQIQMNNAKTAEAKEEIQIYLALFWSIVSQLSSKDFRSLLHFITATHRRPTLRPAQDHNIRSPIVINILDSISLDETEQNTYPLPTASTCSNTLFLPHYPSFEILERCLLLAIREGNQGFGLS